ncbi:MAG: hypothetical protein ACJ74U_10890 [Jatrophihabitantaceae bacterium]
MDLPTASEELRKFATSMFGERSVSTLRFSAPDAIEISVSTGDAVAGEVKISLYDELNLQIAGMHFEYGPFTREGVDEVKRLLTAAGQGRLRKKKRQLFRMTVGYSLQIDD